MKKKKDIYSTKNIKLTKAAKVYLLYLIKKKKNKKGIKIYIKKTGCAGYTYKLKLIKKKKKKKYTIITYKKFFIAISKKNFLLINGCKIDYVKKGLNKKLIFFNKKITNICGCGKSVSFTM